MNGKEIQYYDISFPIKEPSLRELRGSKKGEGERTESKQNVCCGIPASLQEDVATHG